MPSEARPKIKIMKKKIGPIMSREDRAPAPLPPTPPPTESASKPGATERLK